MPSFDGRAFSRNSRDAFLFEIRTGEYRRVTNLASVLYRACGLSYVSHASQFGSIAAAARNCISSKFILLGAQIFANRDMNTKHCR